MQFIKFDQLVLEVTRRCNMACPHCIRGDAETKDIDFATIENVLRDVRDIGCITFTGGEPTLNIPAMQHTLEYCLDHDIAVGSFYIVTNGKVVSSEFLHLCIDWFTYCVECSGDESLSGVALSKDVFHEEIPYKNELRLRAFSFFRTEKFTNWEKVSLQNLGRARTLNGYKKREPSRYPISIEEEQDSIRVESDVLISVTGDVLPDCDYEYNEMANLSIGNVLKEDLSSILNHYMNEQAEENEIIA